MVNEFDVPGIAINSWKYIGKLTNKEKKLHCKNYKSKDCIKRDWVLAECQECYEEQPVRRDKVEDESNKNV